MKAPYGKCHLCGKQGKLSFEHVPPAAAFNSDKAFVMNGADVLGKDRPWDFSAITGKQLQRGIGFYRLCEKCNNDTGGKLKYAPAFVEFDRQGFEAVGYRPDEVTMSQVSIQFHNIYPLRILKEIICMFCCINPAELADVHPELRAFVLDPYKFGTLSPDEFAISVYLLRGPFSRNAGKSVHLTGLDDTPSAAVLSELSAPPFGFIMHFKPHRRRPTTDILSFANYHYDDCHDIRLDIHVYSCNSPLPGDFREQEEIMRTYINNKLKEMVRRQGLRT